MFVAWRDMRFATGRFVLIGAVVTLITLLVGFLSGLTAGLANQNISAVTGLGANSIVFSAPADGEQASFSDSVVTKDMASDWAAVPGVDRAEPIGITQTRLETDDTRTSVSLFGVEPSFGADAPSADGELRLSAAAAKELKITTGDSVSAGAKQFTVESVGDDAWYSHTPVVWMTAADWRTMAAAMSGAGAVPTTGAEAGTAGTTASAASGAPFATVIAVFGNPTGAASDAADAQAGTVAKPILPALMAIGSFRSEIGSLLLMVAMLFGISALVIGAFFTVWTIQRRGDVAILKALGATTKRLTADALGQAFVLLLVGVGVGIGLTALLGSLAGTALPFVLSPLTTLAPGVVMIVLGLAGAAFALRSILTADPLTALGGNR
ncbi:FtsX-like permease family protein [Plantibacter sp. YIM 135347]|uniref:ABC transporter permease n=1 Tax=Plantibacter sp. YIM 135347 TaxID=3423919 RepID=UPI003D33A7B4